MVSIMGCSKDDFTDEGNVDDNPVKEPLDIIDYSIIPQSDIYEGSII